MRTVIGGAAAVVVLGLAGGAAFLAARDDEAPPPTTTTTTTTVPVARLVAALADALEAGLEVPLTETEARCVAEAVVAVVGEDALADAIEAPRTAVLPADETQRDELVRGLVGCVPASTAAVLLGGSTSTTTPLVLPDEGG